MNRNDFTVFENTPSVILSQALADYTALTGRKLQPGQSETLLLNVFAYREYLVREQANEALRNSLLPFAIAPMLDYLGTFVGVERLPATGALSVLSFDTGGNNPTAIVVPAGTRVATDNGEFTFETVSDLTIPARFAGPVLYSVEAECTVAGIAGNAQLPTVILDPQAYVLSATPTLSTGGSDGENDEQLRARIQLAPNAFSVAGPRKAYQYFAKAAHPDIIDVAVANTFPGEVTLYPLVSGGVPAAVILAAVELACNAEDVRPLCDTVKVVPPTVTNYTIEVELELFTGTAAAATQASVKAALLAYANERASALGRDVVRERIQANAMPSTVYRATVQSPAATVVIAENEVAICTAVNVTVTGFNNG